MICSGKWDVRSSALIQCEFFLPRKENERLKYIFDSWFDELFDELSWDFVCKEQENHDKAAYLAISFFPQEGDYQFAKKWLFRKPNKFFDFLSSQLK